MNANVTDEKTNVFLVRMAGNKLEIGKTTCTLVVGWSKAADMSSELDWGRFKRKLAEAYADWDSTDRAIANMASSLYLFLHNIKRGDLVVIPVPDGFYVVRVNSKPFHLESEIAADTAWRMNVEWLVPRPIPRSHASYPLQKRLKARQTVLDITDLKADVIEAMSTAAPPKLTARMAQSLTGPLVEFINRFINDQQLEDLVRRLAQASGARARVMPKRDARPGDVDVTAVHDLGIGNSGATITVAYQVKHHQGTSSNEGIQQLIDRMESDPSLNKGCFITAAEDVTEDARNLAAENDIVVMTRADLVDWILSVGLSTIAAQEAEFE